MNPDQPSREQIEARITALLLGELPADEAALLRYTIAQDPALQKLHSQLQSAFPLVREAAKHPADAPAEKPAPLKLSTDRREKLLAHFKTPRQEAPQEPLFWLKRIKVSTLVKVLSVVTILGLIAALTMPALKNTGKTRGQYETIHGAFSFREWLAEKFPANKAEPERTTVQTASATTSSSAPPTVVTLGSEPQLASPPAVPPVQIVLPAAQLESGQLADNNSLPARAGGGGAQSMTAGLLSPEEIASKITAPRTSGVYSQNIVGYLNHPLDGQTVTTTPAATTATLALQAADSEAVMRQADAVVEKQREASSHSMQSSGAGGIGGGGFGGTSHAYGGSIAINRNGTLNDATKYRLLDGLHDSTNSVALAWDDSGVNRSLGENQTFGPQPAPAAMPAGSFPVTQSPKTETQASADRRYYRKAARQPEETENKKLPDVATAEPAFQNSTFASTPPPAQMPAPITTGTPVVANTFNFNTTPGGVQPTLALNDNSPLQSRVQSGVTPDMVAPQHGLHVDGLTAGAVSDVSKTSPVAGEPGWTGVLENPDTPHGPDNHFVTRYAYADKTPISLDQVQSTNYMAMNSGANNVFSPGVSAVTPDVSGHLMGKLGVSGSDNETLALNQALNYPGHLTDKLSVPHSADETLNHSPGITPFTPQQEETIAAGTINFQGMDLNEVLDIYAKLANRTVLRGDLPQTQIILNTQTPLTKPESIQTLQTVLALNGISLVNVGDKFVKVLPSDQAGTAGGEIDRSGSTNASALGRYLTQVVQLKNVKPTEMLQVIRPFAGLTNSILPMDNDGVLVLRDNPTNLERMLKMIQQVDVSVPAEYISEVVPIRYAKVDDIASALNALGGGATVTVGSGQGSSQISGFSSGRSGGFGGAGVNKQEIQLFGQTKIIANESSSSLLIYATRADMVTIKGAIEKLDTETKAAEQSDLPIRKPAPNTPLPQPEILTTSNAFSTFSLNVSDVSFKLAEASLENGKLPDTASIRSEEFINAFDYRDPEAAPGQPMAFTSERAAYPFAHNRDLLRFSIKTAAAGRQEGRPLNLVLLLDTSGSMERADRVQIIHEALRVLATQLHENDIVSVVSFARTARLWADGVSGDKAGDTLDKVGSITPEGGTNLEEAMRLAYETARRHYLANGMNRVVLLTDGAANLGNVDPNALKEKVEAQRKQGIALDCFGIGWEDLNDDLLEELSSNGDGRYAFLNSPEDAAKDFGTKLAGALQVAAQDVKVQVEFNPQRVISYRQIGYAKHQLTKEQFRDNTVAAAEIAAQEAGNALYTVVTNPNGDGPIATVHVRYRIPGTQDYHEHSWDVAYTGNAPALDLSSPAMRLAATASAFSEWLAASPYAQEVTPDALAKYLTGVPEVYGADDRPKQLETMIREAKSLEGK